MCGIAGWFDTSIDFEKNRDVLNKISKTMERRGPDENGIYITNDVALIHRRLVVIDKENGTQPMTVLHKDKKYTIVYNGELYNTDDIRSKLIGKGFKFRGRSDTEVVLKSYICWGKECAKKLNGIFAFAIYEINSRELFLCRDRIGVKPLFYHKYKNGLIFASEIKSILSSGIVKPVVDENGLYEIFFMGPARTPGCGVFKNIEELKPGELAVYKNGKLEKEFYFQLKAKEHTDSLNDTIEKTRFLLTDSIKKQLVSDMPLCFFLSGGLDSSIISKVAAMYSREKNKGRIHTYSVEYEDNGKYFQKSLFQPNRDDEYIKMMVKDTHSIHHEVVLDHESLADALLEATDARDLPGMADIDSSLLLFCKKIKQDYTVSLSGECADELFGGYPWYHNKSILFEQCFPWSKDQSIRRKILKKGLLPKGEDYVYERYQQTCKKTDKLKSDSEVSARMREMFVLNFYYFMQCLLDRKDRMSMYSGLEVRVPFCDYRIVEYAYNMPWEIKAYDGREKGIVRKAFEDILPEEICWRKKSPYPKTHNPVYMNIVSNRVMNILNKKDSVLTEMLDKEGIKDIIQHPDDITVPWYGQLMRAPQIMAYIIELDHWFTKYNVSVELQ
ncbi:MAG: asparagine synthase (glutamine-hydrolyzing) [Oscillospiraceae bacterium]|nr:asparagine synthase (glutamine-hydrolyzing) [Oscillospiraceae bacterium]